MGSAGTALEHRQDAQHVEEPVLTSSHRGCHNSNPPNKFAAPWLRKTALNTTLGLWYSAWNEDENLYKHYKTVLLWSAVKIHFPQPVVTVNVNSRFSANKKQRKVYCKRIKQTYQNID